MTRDEQIAAELAVADEATPGPWLRGSTAYCPHAPMGGHHNIWREPGIDVTDPCAHLTVPDADFIAAARTGYPRALRELAEARALLAKRSCQASDCDDPECMPGDVRAFLERS